MSERELVEPVSLTTPEGRLNTEAVGWARRPLVDTSGVTARRGRTWGRTKRWEYWNVITPTHIVGLTVSSIDYAAVHEVWVYDRSSGAEWKRAATVLPARGVELPARLGSGPSHARANYLSIDLDPLADGGTRIQARIPGASVEVTVTRPVDHDCLAVVVPWSSTRFQYTVKDVALPARGTLTVDGIRYDLPEGESWAVLDHGRGRWPYDVSWNWAAASGVSHGHTVGLQLGARWTAGTGSTENGVLVDGHLYKISEELDWRYEPGDWMRPWHVIGSGLDATLAPFHDKQSRSNLGVVSSRTDQCFGHWSGTYLTPTGETITFDGLEGWAEDVHNRW